MNQIRARLESRLFPRAYKKETRIIDETLLSLWLLDSLASLPSLSEGTQSAKLIESQATEFRTSWEEYELPGLFSIDCPELRAAIERLDVVPERKSALGSESYGLPINIVHSVEPILRGNLEVVETVRLTAFRQAPEVAFYIKIVDDKHELDRDNHHVGWHYHYCKPNGARSDTLISFDTNQPDRFDDKRRINNVPLFWERHSPNKAKFRAKATLWGRDKKRSIWDALNPELSRPLHEFRRPNNSATAVWPTNAILSTRPYRYLNG
jgi:hypothetical protein